MAETAETLKTGDRIHHAKFGKGTVVGPWADEMRNREYPPVTWVMIFNGDAISWGVLLDDETLANKHLEELNQRPLGGKPFPVVPSLESSDIKIITE